MGNSKNARENPDEVISRRKKGIKKDNSEGETSNVLYITHPVYQKQKKIHRVGSVTFLIGRTPKRIRRKQFEEMASDVHMASMKDFAKYIAKATSEERQKILKEFYGSKHPELKDLLKVDAPVSEGNEEGDVRTTQSRKRKLFFKHGKLKSGPSAAQDLPCSTANPCGQKRHEAGATQIQYHPCTQAAVCHNVEDKQLPTVITQDSISGRNSQAFKDFMASDSLSSKSGIIEGLCENTSKGQQNLTGTESPRKPFLSQSESRQAQMCKKNSFADILGDTSILNDLFKSNGTRPTEQSRRSLSEPVEKAKVQPKDFWDMLNEESFQKLTDVAVIKELCDRAPLATTSRETEEDEVSLWKKNDKFLWRKYCTDDMDK
ncbi:hypothetical protein lerEdw1_000173 [Lerista edwardsae]|nr:hypothetical protein lerEdw1_000173 [Lerista edwardsae]